MPGNDWREDVRGIPLWPGSLDVDGGRVERIEDGTVWMHDRGCIGAANPLACGPKLDDPDTLAAFDRRLLQRLGASPDATLQGTGIYPVKGGEAWWFTAGGGGRVPLFSRLLTLNVRDGLLARVRAWKNAAMEAAPR